MTRNCQVRFEGERGAARLLAQPTARRAHRFPHPRAGLRPVEHPGGQLHYPKPPAPACTGGPAARALPPATSRYTPCTRWVGASSTRGQAGPGFDDRPTVLHHDEGRALLDATATDLGWDTATFSVAETGCRRRSLPVNPLADDEARRDDPAWPLAQVSPIGACDGMARSTSFLC